MWPELTTGVFALSAIACSALWLRTRRDLAECRRQRNQLENSSWILEEQRHVLELIAEGASLEEVLQALAKAVEHTAPECVCSILLLDDDRTHLLTGAAPSLPAEYVRAVNGLEIGPDVGSCGSAAYRNETVVVEDIATDFRWAPVKDWVMGFGLRACWSVPIRDSKGRVLGTFAMYHQRPARPQYGELRFVEAGAQLAGNAIERLRAEQRLRESEKRFRLMADGCPAVMWVTNAEGSIQFMNHVYRDLAAAGYDEMEGYDWRPALHPEDATAYIEAFQRAVRDHSRFSAETRARLANGEWRWFTAHAEPRFSPDGEFLGHVGISIDITERKETERAHQFQLSLIRGINEASLDGILVVDEHSNVVSHNRRFLEVWKREDLSETAAVVDQPPLLGNAARTKDPERYLERVRELYENPDADDHCNIELRDGRTLERYSTSLHSDSGRYFGRVWFFRDITERTQLEDELKLTSFALDNMQDAVIWTLSDGRICNVNNAACRMLGYSYEELTALSIPEDISPMDVGGKWDAHWEDLKRAGSLRMQATQRAKDGSQIAVDVTVNHISFQGREYGCAIVRDVGDRIRREKELVLAREAADAANRAKSEFLANMSHEIRTPLNGVMGMLALAAATETPSEQHECLVTARTSAEMLKSVLNDILDVSKIEAGRLELEPLRIDIRAVAEDCIRTFRAQAQQKGLELVLADLAGVPAALVGDPVRLRQVIANLVGNAVKFTEHGRIVVAAQLESLESGHVVVKFSVADTGIGISREQQSIIFEPFRQADGSATRKAGGTGLGLTISARLVELMGGKIWVESEEGNGSTFWFTARFRLATETEYPTAPANAALTEQTDASRPLRILLAEDNPVNQRLAVRLLERHGHMVRVARNGQEAVAFAAGEVFDLILMDVQMPKMDGYAATRRIREREGAVGQRIPIIAMTACTMKGDREKCFDAGMDAYVPKPIDIDALLAVIAKMGAAEPVA